jgi:hypothetical protein
MLAGDPDLLDHDFTAVAPNRKGGTDFTYVLVGIAVCGAFVVIASRGPSWLACGHRHRHRVGDHRAESGAVAPRSHRPARGWVNRL